MAKLLEISWPRILAEATAIVVSILLAFWIQAWWEDTQEREDEQFILISLLDEFHAKKSFLERHRSYNEWLLDSVNSLNFVALGADNNLSRDSIEQLLGTMLYNNAKGLWSAPVLNSVISSGDLASITNSKLRVDLGGWQHRFGLLDDYVAREVDFYHQQFIPFLISNAFIPQMINSNKENPEMDNRNTPKLPVLITYDHLQMISKREFVNLLAERRILISDIIHEAYLNIDEQFDLIILDLEAEIAK